eukprot:22086_1
MGTIYERIRLLVTGISRESDCHNFSDDVISIVELFGAYIFNHHASQWLFEGEEFKKIFSTYAQYIWGTQKFHIMGIPFILTANSIQKTVLAFSLRTSLSKDISILNVAVEINDSNTSKNTLVKFAYNSSENNIFELHPKDNIIKKGNEYNITFGIEIKEFKCHRTKIKDTLKWKLNLNNERKPISRNIKNWSLYIEAIHGQFLKLSIMSVNMPVDIWAIQLKYNLMITDNNNNEITSKGAVNLYNDLGEIHTWNRMINDNGFEIVLCIEIVKIWVKIEDDRKALKRDLWFEYGFV